jgi:hypothetical protein
VTATRAQAWGLLLFLFIPAVLYLLVAHPPPLGASLAAGVALMLGHRFVARPYMRRALEAKCLWCNGALPQASAAFRLRSGGEMIEARCCPEHAAPLRRFFGALDEWRWPLRLGIFVPLLALVGALAAAALGGGDPRLPAATALFKLAVGLTVNLAALGPLVGSRRERPEPAPEPAVPFPAHNFFLLGVRSLLWIFRLVGLWWIVQGARFFL